MVVHNKSATDLVQTLDYYVNANTQISSIE